jgi:hypothetical protein
MAKTKTMTELEIERLEKLRETKDPLNLMNDDYKVINQRLKELYELREMEKKKKIEPPTWDGLLKVGGFVVLGGLIVFKEHLIGPLGNTKALNFLTKIL